MTEPASAALRPASPRPAALVTGASAGIGYELAKLLAAGGYDLVLVARSADRLRTLATELRVAHHVAVRVLPKDLADPAAPQQIFDDLAAAGVAIEALVNNAGFGSHGPFHEADLAIEMAMVQVNIAALTHLTRLFLPPMVAPRGHGRILNVASTAAFQPGPLMAVYYASKAYVLSFTEAIASELKRTGVTATALCPGPTETEFQQRAHIKASRLFEANMMGAAPVALAGYRGMLAGERSVIPGLKNRLLAFGTRLLPKRLVISVAKKLNSAR